MSVDTLSLACELRAADLGAVQAESIASAIGRAVVETAATKADPAELRAATKADLTIVEGNLRTGIAKLDTRIEAATSKLVFSLVGTLVAVGGIVVASVKLIPAQG